MNKATTGDDSGEKGGGAGGGENDKFFLSWFFESFEEGVLTFGFKLMGVENDGKLNWSREWLAGEK